MKIDLCKIFGVEEGEEFKFEGENEIKYRIYQGELHHTSICCKKVWYKSYLELNDISGKEIIKLPKKKQFTDDELAIMRSLPKKYEYIARDSDSMLYAFCSYKPKKENNCWDNKGLYKKLDFFNHLFQSIQWEDEEPVYIPDYVEKGVE